METSTRLPARDMVYRVPPQDLRIDLARMPTFPASRFVIERVAMRPAS